MPTTRNLRAVGDRIEQLVDAVHAGALPREIEQIDELLALVTELYGAALARVVDIVGAQAPSVLTALVDDDLVSSVLVVHSLHPESVRARVERALAEVRPLLAHHGGDVELVDVDLDAATVHLRLVGSCDGCPSSAITLRTAIEQAIVDAAPEIATVDVVEPPAAGATTSVAIGRKPAPVYERCPEPSALVVR